MPVGALRFARQAAIAERLLTRETAMKELVWDRVLSVENDEIDNDHRILVDLFNLLGRFVMRLRSFL